MRDTPKAAPGQAALPSYAHPPLVQVRLSIRVAEPVPLTVDRLTEQLGPVWIAVPSSLSAEPDHRSVATRLLTFRSVLGDQRLNVQPTGVDFLWDGRTGDAYPHYESLRDVFLTAYDAWDRMAGDATPIPSRWQIAYRNRFPRGTVWQRLDDLQFCRLLATVSAAPHAAELKEFEHVWKYRLNDPQAELRCDAWFESDVAGEDTIWLALTCEGECRADGEEWLAEMDAARRLIVATFRELMSPEANAYWGMLGS